MTTTETPLKLPTPLKKRLTKAGLSEEQIKNPSKIALVFPKEFKKPKEVYVPKKIEKLNLVDYCCDIKCKTQDELTDYNPYPGEECSKYEIEDNCGRGR